MRTVLFDFLTIRNTEAISREDKEQYHIHLVPELVGSTHYFKNHSSDKFSELKAQINRRAEDFNGLLTLNQIKNNFSALYKLYREIKSEKFRASYQGLRDMVNELAPKLLKNKEEAQLWDNFIHYLWVDPQKDEVDTITAIFIANKYLSAYQRFSDSGDRITENERNVLRRITRAKIVIPIPVDNRLEDTFIDSLSAGQKSLLETAHNRFVSEVELNQLEILKTELLSISTEVARELNNTKENEIKDTLLALNITMDNKKLEPLVGRHLAANKPILRKDHVVNRLSANSRTSFKLIENNAAELAPSLKTLDIKIEELAVTIEDDIEVVSEESFFLLGNELTTEEHILPGSFIVKGKWTGINQFDYYLTYYYEESQDQLINVKGTIAAGGREIPVTSTLLPEKQHGFQTYKLNAEPIPIQDLRAEIELQLTRMKDNTARPVQPFQLLETIAHFDVLDVDEIEDFTAQPPPLFGINRLGIADFRRVEQEIACYLPGEVSLIENIMASEYKEKVTRSLTSHETETEITEEFGFEKLSDTEIADKLEMQSEAATVINEEKSRSLNGSTGINVGFGKSSFNASFGFSFNSASSREESNSQALQIAKSITNRIQDKITQKRTTVRRTKFKHEFESTNKHGFDNRLGQEHVVGIYRWVDKVYNNYLVNHGRRLMYEFNVPAPALNFIRAQTLKAERERHGLKKPKSLKQIGLTGVKKLKRNNYMKFAAHYGINVLPPPDDTITLSRTFSGSIALSEEGAGSAAKLGNAAAYNELEIPEGYIAKHGTVKVNPAWDEEVVNALQIVDIEDAANAFRKLDAFIAVFFAGERHTAVPDGIQQLTMGIGEEMVSLLEIDDEEYGIQGMVPVSITSRHLNAYSIGVTVICKLSKRMYEAWQLETYNQIKAAYNDQLAKYESAIAEYEAGEEEVNLNPAFKKEIIERELKAGCIHLLTEPFKLDVTFDHYPQAPKEKPLKFKVTPKLDKHAERVTFLEMAFEWHLLAYIFYPYFYGKESKWLKNLATENGKDKLFESFLTSALSRIVLPVRQGFETAVTHYLQTGEVWLGGDFVLDVKNDLYLSVADELNTGNEEFTIEETWQSKIPTDLTILQNRSAALDDEGLPCNIAENKIGTGTSILDPVLSPDSSNNT